MLCTATFSNSYVKWRLCYMMQRFVAVPFLLFSLTISLIFTSPKWGGNSLWQLANTCGVSQGRSGLRSILSSLGQARRRQNKRTKRTGSAAQSADPPASTSADLQARTSANQATGTILSSANLFFIGLINNYLFGASCLHLIMLLKKSLRFMTSVSAIDLT